MEADEKEIFLGRLRTGSRGEIRTLEKKKKKKRGETRYRHNIPLNKANEEVPPTIVVFARILSAGMEANKAREFIMENH